MKLHRFTTETSLMRRIRAVQSGQILYVCGVRLPILSTTPRKG